MIGLFKNRGGGIIPPTRLDYDKKRVPDLVMLKNYSINNQVLYLEGEDYPVYNWNYRRLIELMEAGIVGYKDSWL